MLGGYILKFVNTRRFFLKKKKKKYISDFKITAFGYFRTREEELVVLMKRTGSCKHGYLIFQNVWQWHICISENQFFGFWESRLWTLRTILITTDACFDFFDNCPTLVHTFVVPIIDSSVLKK